MQLTEETFPHFIHLILLILDLSGLFRVQFPQFLNFNFEPLDNLKEILLSQRIFGSFSSLVLICRGLFRIQGITQQIHNFKAALHN